MLIIEVEDGGNMSIIRRLEGNGFWHDRRLDYIDRKLPGLPHIEVWTKRDGNSKKTFMDISDLPEIQE